MAMKTKPEPDSEKGHSSENALGGYARLAKLMGDVPDLALFYRFPDLSVQSLLHYQAELCELRSELQKIQAADRNKEAGTFRNQYDFNSSDLRESYYSDSGDNDGVESRRRRRDAKKQWETILRIRQIIKEYYEALSLHRQIVNLPKPPQAQLDDLNDWMRRPTRGNMYLKGDDDDLWKLAKLNELITMEQPIGDNSSSSTIGIIKLYHRVIGRFIHEESSEDHMQNTIVYTNEGAISVVRGIKTLAACMIPILGIVVLSFVQNQGARLGVIAAWTAIFSVTLSAFTPATIKDIFSATAAFSAVLVVFVGTN